MVPSEDRRDDIDLYQGRTDLSARLSARAGWIFETILRGRNEKTVQLPAGAPMGILLGLADALKGPGGGHRARAREQPSPGCPSPGCTVWADLFRQDSDGGAG